MEDYNISDFTSFSNFSTTQNVSQCSEKEVGPRRDSLYVVIPIIVIYVIIFVSGVVGNISTCIVISRNKSMHTATNYYLFSLAISDLVLLISGLPAEIYLHWYRYPYIFGSTFCFLRGLFSETSANATVLTITAFTVERYLAICYPFLSHTMSKLSRAIKLILCIWIIATVVAVLQAKQLTILGPPECSSCTMETPFMENAFEISTFVFFVTPMAVITVLYALIGYSLSTSPMVNRRNSNARVQTKASKKVVKMLVAVVVAFFICWAPFHAQRLYFIYSQPVKGPTRTFYFKIYEIVTYISGVMYYMSASINPILYNIMSVKFREAFKETFAKCCGLVHLKSNRPQRSYSVLSRSAQRAPDSTSSGRDDPSVHTHTSITHKSSVDSFCSINHGGRRHKTSVTLRGNDIKEENPTEEHNGGCPNPNGTIAPLEPILTIKEPEDPKETFSSSFMEIFRYLQCIAKNKRGHSKRYTYYYESPSRGQERIVELQSPISDRPNCNISPCEISNSSLKDIENGAIEDELTAYMKEVRRRELCS